MNPVGMVMLADGNLLVAEEGTGQNDASAGVSVVTTEGKVGRLISGLPSSRDSGDLSGVPLVGVQDAVLYLGNFAQGHLWSFPLPDPLVIPETPFGIDDLTAVMLPNNAVQLINPFDITFDAEGNPVVTDASANGVATTNAAGLTTFFHQFAPIPQVGKEVATIDAVPTGIEKVGNEYFVTLTGGCPYPEGNGRLVAINTQRDERIIADNLTMPIDVAKGADGAIWVLEFATFASENPFAFCFTGEGYQPQTGRLSLLQPDGSLELKMDGLNYPGAILPLEDGSILYSEVFTGRIWRVDGLAHATTIRQAPAHASPPPPSEPISGNWQFRDVATDVGLDFVHGAFPNGISEDPVAMMGGGVCWLDYDKDGWLDLYLVNSHALADRTAYPRNALYRNDAGQFSEVSAESGTDLQMRGNGCISADWNNDGWVDIYVTAVGFNRLLWNNGDGTFTEGAAVAGVASPEWSTAASTGDLNGDGLLDIFVASYIDLGNKIPNPSGAFPQDFYGLADHLYINQGDGTFLDVTVTVGLTREERGLGSLLSDFDQDGDLDLHIANDGHPNRLYENQPAQNEAGFLFVDLTETANVGDSGSGMGVAGGDYNADGSIDIVVTNWQAELNALYGNNGDMTFRYNTYRMGMMGLGENLTGWGTAWADFDHDMDLDLMTVNGYVPISDLQADKQLVQLYGNLFTEQGRSEFRPWTEQVGLEAVGPFLARGSAVADYDNDGDLDIAINQIGGQVALLQHQGSDGNWLILVPDGVYAGLRVEVWGENGRLLTRELHTGSSYLASEDPRIHFGLGRITQVDKLIIYWPNGKQTTVQDVPVNQFYPLTQP